ncbi:hypothetical protein V8C37DRAFT_292501 [Trichoderma ceciliae]
MRLGGCSSTPFPYSIPPLNRGVRSVNMHHISFDFFAHSRQDGKTTTKNKKIKNKKSLDEFTTLFLSLIVFHCLFLSLVILSATEFWKKGWGIEIGKQGSICYGFFLILSFWIVEASAQSPFRKRKSVSNLATSALPGMDLI